MTHRCYKYYSLMCIDVHRFCDRIDQHFCSPYAIGPFSPVLSLLYVTFVYCGQTVGGIKMPLGTEVSYDPGHILLDGDPASPKGAQPPIFGPCLLWPNGWMDQEALVDQDTTWYGGRPRHRHRRHCVRWRPSRPPKGAQQLPPPLFGMCNCGQMTGWAKMPFELS